MGLDNRDRMVAAWGISGTKDMEDLKKSISLTVKKDETVAINMENFIWNFWVSYLLHGHSNYIITNKKLPIFETKLPDPITQKYIDPDGIPRVEPKFEVL
ncbi:MAG TPA: hypothetical protein PK453_20470, partial [Leptospiraceae bacterium]|nr:hypothetical protein [Leptospiraceae bacterium]HNN06515.1 hypothetical protein [Leptospiraceae bacterium]